MNRFIISNSLAVALLTGTMSFAQSSVPAESNKAIPASIASDTVDVQHVIDAYQEAVLNHDGSRLARLFIPQGSMWLNVLSDDTYAHAKAKSPDAQKIRLGKLRRLRQDGVHLKGQLQSNSHASPGEQ